VARPFHAASFTASPHGICGPVSDIGFFCGASESGGLISFGNNTADLFRRAASYIDRILRGAKPADLPVQLPMKFEMVINLKTAKALGVAVPAFLLQSADGVIE